MMRRRSEVVFGRGFSRTFRLASVIALLSILSSAAMAMQSVMVGWNPGTDPGIAGYAVYYGTTNGVYSKRLDVGTNTSTTISGLVEGQTNYFAVAAYNAASIEGTASSALTFIVPGYLKISSLSGNGMSFPVAQGHYYVVQATTNLVSWTNIWQSSTASSNVWVSYQDPQAGSLPHRFYRLVLH
jgi:hypothetical protein